MFININIIGEGTVTGAGEYQVGDTAMLTAIPESDLKFGYFEIGKIVEDILVYKKYYTDNLTIEIENDTNLDITVYFYMDMKTYLTADYEFDIKHTALAKVATKRGFKLSDDSETISEKTRDLATADLLIIVTNTPSMIQGKTEKAGNWSETQGSRTLSITDKKDMRNRANVLYTKWGETMGNGVTATLKRVFY